MVMRQKVWIDGSVQGVLIGRVVLYWTVGILYVALGSICFQYYEHPDWGVGQHIGSLFDQFWPWIPSLILFMPLVIHDIVRMSNLFAGPIYRLRVHLAELLVDSHCRPLKFREDDYWQDLVAPMNQLQDDINALRVALDAALQINATKAVAESVLLEEERDEAPEAGTSDNQVPSFLVNPKSEPVLETTP